LIKIDDATRRYVLGVLVVVYTFNFIDRQILSILLEPIKHDLGLSDTQLGVLGGFAFALFYATLGMPIARIADRSNRRNLVAISLAVWSAMTAFAGVALNFWQLLIARIGVGVGEAGCSPASHSIISDYYPARRRATALGIYALGIPFGTLFGLVAGGWINDFFGWRVAFFVVGLPGLLLALLVRYTIREPPRGLAEGRVASDDQPGMTETTRFLMTKRSFRHFAFGAALTAFVGYGFVQWTPAFFVRSHGMNVRDVGTVLGFIIGIAGGIGIWLGGALADRLGGRDPRWYLRIVAVGLVVAWPFSAGAFLASSPSLALTLLVVPVLLGNFYQATTFSQTQGLVGLRMRAVAAAVLLFIINIIGLGAGPTVVGILADLLRDRFGVESLRYALLICSLVNLWSALHYYIGANYLSDDLEKA
jgi:predicted MFS family arabinose efflux permease